THVAAPAARLGLEHRAVSPDAPQALRAAIDGCPAVSDWRPDRSPDAQPSLRNELRLVGARHATARPPLSTGLWPRGCLPVGADSNLVSGIRRCSAVPTFPRSVLISSSSSGPAGPLGWCCRWSSSFSSPLRCASPPERLCWRSSP